MYAIKILFKGNNAIFVTTLKQKNCRYFYHFILKFERIPQTINYIKIRQLLYNNN